LQLAALERGRGAGVAVGQPRERLVPLAPEATLAGPQSGEAEPRGDRVEPGRELRLAAKVRDRPVGAEEYLLGPLLGLRRVPEHPRRHADDPLLVPSRQLLEGLAVAGSEPGDERRLVGRRFPHGPSLPQAPVPGKKRHTYSLRGGGGRKVPGPPGARSR